MLEEKLVHLYISTASRLYLNNNNTTRLHSARTLYTVSRAPAFVKLLAPNLQEFRLLGALHHTEMWINIYIHSCCECAREHNERLPCQGNRGPAPMLMPVSRIQKERKIAISHATLKKHFLLHTVQSAGRRSSRAELFVITELEHSKKLLFQKYNTSEASGERREKQRDKSSQLGENFLQHHEKDEREKSFSSGRMHAQLVYPVFQVLDGKKSPPCTKFKKNRPYGWIAKNRGGGIPQYSAERCFQTQRERGHVEFINRVLGKRSAAHWWRDLVNFCLCQTTSHEFFMNLQLTDRKSIYTARLSFGR